MLYEIQLMGSIFIFMSRTNNFSMLCLASYYIFCFVKKYKDKECLENHSYLFLKRIYFKQHTVAREVVV